MHFLKLYQEKGEKVECHGLLVGNNMSKFNIHKMHIIVKRDKKECSVLPRSRLFIKMTCLRLDGSSRRVSRPRLFILKLVISCRIIIILTQVKKDFAKDRNEIKS